MQLKIVAAAIAVSLLSSASAHTANPPLQVTLASCPASKVTGFVGTYPGSDAPGAMRQFLGIPYAAPPTVTRRWMPPQAPTCWTGNRNMTVFGKSCPQGPGLDPWESEDCLTLNVFTKSTGTVAQQPVMVFIHGGGLISGSGSFQANPYSLLEQGVTVVTLNYRIGALGFLAHSGLSHKTGNFGILDQQAALKWIKSNISKFGGNPNNVTIFGQSAGGLSVLVHLLSPLSNGLFHKAIVQSGSFYDRATPLAEARQKGSNFAGSAGCSNATCLRGLPVNTILAKQNPPGQKPPLGQSVQLLTQDNIHLKNTLKALLEGGFFKKVPTIVGSTQHETRFHIAGNPSFGTGSTCNFVSNITPGNYSSKLQFTNVPSQYVGDVQGAYPPGSTPMSANIALAQQWTDAHYACRTLRVNKWMAAKGGKNFAYEFSDATAPATMWPPFKLSDGKVFPYGAYHGAEQPSLFRMGTKNVCGSNVPTLTPVQKSLSTAMVTYWTTFAKTGNPKPAVSPLPAWPEFTATGSLMSFQGSGGKLITASAFNTAHKCSSFWDSRLP